MAVTVSINGTNHTIPQAGETGWGDSVTAWVQAVSSHLLQKTGGNFTLTSEVDFGSTAGIKTLYYKSRAANPSSTGIVRLGNQEAIGWRNQANNADLSLLVNQSDKLTFNSLELVDTSLSNLTGLIADTHVSGSAAIAYSKLNLASAIVNADVSNSAAIAYSKLNLTSSIVNADIAVAQAIAFSKMESLTASRVLQSSAGGVLEPSSVTTTELGYVSGVTSAIQTQIDSKVTRPGSSTDNAVSRYDGITGQVQNSGVTIDDSNNVAVPGNLVVTGDLTVNGTTTTLNTATLDVEDKNITVNALGSDASAEGAGLTVDRTGTNGSLIYAAAAATKFKIGDEGSEVEVADISTAQTLSNKTLTSPLLTTGVVDDGLDLIEEASLSSPSAGRKRLGLKSDGKLYLRDSSGNETQVGSGGGSGVNYILNPDAETDTTGWATYKDQDQATPENGTGGTSSLTWTRSTTSPLRGLASFLLTKSGSVSERGEGVSYDFSIARSDRAKVLQIDVDYEILTGTYQTGDLTFWIYDVTNSTLIQPSGYQLEAVGTGVIAKARLTFQTASNSESYRLLIHTASATTQNFTILFDNFSLGPQVVPLGAPVTDWVPYTVSSISAISGTLTNYTVTAYQKRNGDSASYRFRLLFSGAAGTWSQPIFPLPSGQVIDTAKIPGGLDFRQYTGGRLFDSSPGVNYEASGFIYTTTSVLAQFTSTVTHSGTAPAEPSAITQSAPFAWASGDGLYFEITDVPIVGWSSSTVVSSSAATRAVVARYTTATAGSYGTGGAILDFTTKVIDTHGAVTTGASWKFTAPVPGNYRVGTGLSPGGTNGLYAVVGKNGADYARVAQVRSGSGAPEINGSTIVALSAGDYIQIAVYSETATTSLATNAVLNYVDIELIQGPSQIAASEVIAFRASNTAGTSFTGGAGFVDVPFVTEAFDTHGAFATPTFTAPAPGLYELSFNLFTNGATLTTSQSAQAQLVVTGASAANYSGFLDTGNGASKNLVLNGSIILQMNAGDTAKLQFASDVTAVLNSTAGRNYFQAQRLGGV